MHISLDLETYDTVPSAVVLSIGAVRFDAQGVRPERYHAVLTGHLHSQLERGRTMGEDTVRWWDQQSQAARDIFSVDHINHMRPIEALEDFARFIGPGATMWGYGADFDCVILQSLYRSFELPLPWDWRNNRCARTLEAVAGKVEVEQIGVKHCAIDDARTQAAMVIELMRRIGRPL